WWFEGPAWLEQTAREMHRVGVTRMTMGETLEAAPPRQTLALPEGSWGEGGDHRVWLNRETEWTWDRVYSAEAEWVGLLKRLSAAGAEAQRVLAQVSRELLILEASDWQFLITTGAARDYAERRVAEHYVEFKRLSELADMLLRGEPMTPEGAALLQRLEREDFPFPDLEATWGQPPPPRGSQGSA
ncbi:MAG: 1,4-alpha-glucan branching protein domain-containing protein, partial [Candidatus Rokuibacteriota bacterium]